MQFLFCMPFNYFVKGFHTPSVSNFDVHGNALSVDEVETVMTCEPALTSISAPSSRPHKYYAVRRGLHLGIYDNWAKCSKEVTCFKGARFKGFRSKAEAEKFLTQQGD